LISFRFHLVSIVAVFLALALGVLVGTTVVNQGVIDDLNGRVDKAVTRSDDLRNQVGALQAQQRAWESFGRAVEPLLVSNQLTGQRVVMVTLEGVDLSEVDGVRQALQDAGATVESVLFVTARMALTDESSQTQLAGILGTGTTTPANLAADAARQLASRLAVGAVPIAGSETSGAQDLLSRLAGANFLVVRGATGPLDAIGGPDDPVVVLSGGSQDPVVEPSMFLEPLISALVDDLRPVVATETVDTAYAFVPLVREDGALDGRLVTVDNADSLVGRIAVVLGLRDLLATSQGGHYGVKPGATGLIPKP
jgi:hypothetical protein